MELEAEEIVGGGGLVFAGVGEEFVPDIEGVFFKLPTFFFTEVGDGGAEVCFVRSFVGVAGERSGGLIFRSGNCRESDPVSNPCEEALEVLLLL